MGGGFYVQIEPQLSSRVSVEVAAYNSKVYYVQGEVGSPGRLPSTGRDTVLDAIQYCGGLLGSADPTKITLRRPAQGDNPQKIYPIDYEAILEGSAQANLQLFPRDRLVVGSRQANPAPVPIRVPW